MATINYISKYNCAKELLDEFCCMDFWGEMDDDDICFLNHFDDFEGFGYYCVNAEEIYVTDFYGDVMYSCKNFNDFLLYVMEWLNDDRKARNA